MTLSNQPVENLKRQAILFDKFHIWPDFNLRCATASSRADLNFLLSNELVVSAGTFLPKHYDTGVFDVFMPEMQAIIQHGSREESLDAITRAMAMTIKLNDNFDIAPICLLPLPEYLLLNSIAQSKQTVLRVAFDALPIPGSECAWQDIIDFKAEGRDKKWNFHRFLRTLSTKEQTEPEIRDDIEWSLNEYAKAMKIHHIKASHGLVDAFLITPLEILETCLSSTGARLPRARYRLKSVRSNSWKLR